ncbi:MAG: hypothetical protein J6O60_10070 [Lachnospiraceae bacterium]|nr:hypothetical protein [Lachnospiraceae bacterium]
MEKNYNIDAIYDYMEKINGRVITDIKSSRGKTIADYCGRIWVNDIKTDGMYATNARQHIISTLYEYIQRHYDKEIATDAVEEFKKLPVFQTGPHFQLAIEKNNFFTALFSIIGIKNAGGKYYFNATCSTPSLETRKKYGPMWLNVYDSNFNIFDFSQMYRKHHSVYNAYIEKPYLFKSYLGNNNAEKAEQYVFMLRELLSEIKEKRMVKSLLIANKKLWTEYLSDQVMPIYILEDFYCDLMINMLEDRDSMLYVLFSNTNKQRTVLDEINKYKESEWAEMVPTSTDFFWKVTECRFKSIKLHNNEFIELDGMHYMYNDIDEIVVKLKNREIIPNIFSIVLMESLLGQVRLVGGLHQFLYYNVFKLAFLKALDLSIPKEKELFILLESQELNHWGSHVLEPDVEVAELIQKGDKIYDRLKPYYEKYSFDKAIDDMKQFRRYHRWRVLLDCQ